jgi:hypothetical protein
MALQMLPLLQFLYLVEKIKMSLGGIASQNPGRFHTKTLIKYGECPKKLARTKMLNFL